MTLLTSNTTLRIATAVDKPFLIALARKFSNQLGFIPAEALDWYIDNGDVQLALENGEPAGYLLGRDALRWNIALRPITQAAIAFDAQRRHNGLALVTATAATACEAGQVALQAMCREGIEANDFWKAAGFTEIGRYDPQNARRRQIICWRKLLTKTPPPWWRSMPQYAGHRARKVNHVR